jgi:hypothetical protein
MEIKSPSLTSAKGLISSVSADGSTGPTAVAGGLKDAEKNNREAAGDISKLTSDQKNSAVANENKSAARVQPEEVDAFAEELKVNIKKFPEVAKSAVSDKLTPNVVSLLLS